MNNPQSFTHY